MDVYHGYSAGLLNSNCIYYIRLPTITCCNQKLNTSVNKSEQGITIIYLLEGNTQFSALYSMAPVIGVSVINHTD